MTGASGGICVTRLLLLEKRGGGLGVAFGGLSKPGKLMFTAVFSVVNGKIASLTIYKFRTSPSYLVL